MKVIIDISPLQSAHKGRGIGIYTRNLVAALERIDNKNKYLLTTKSSQVKDADIIHYPYFDLFFRTLPLKKRAKSVVTIHDLIPLIFPKDFPPGIKGRIRLSLQKMSLSNIDAIITDSQNSKNDIIRLLKIDPAKIKVIYLASDERIKPANQKSVIRIRKEYKLPEKFILYVGDVNPNKNLLILIKAFSLVVKNHPDTHLVLVGRALSKKLIPEVKEIKEQIKKFNLEDKVHLISNVPLDPVKDLSAIYTAATLYIQPSLYEGFGLPILEAFACKTPVVAANSSSIPEVASDAAILVDPSSEDNIYQGINLVLNLDQSSVNNLVNKGTKQLHNFSWEKTAAETLDVYKSLYQGK